MASVINRLYSDNLINPPSWLPANTMFEGWTGSVSYGANTNTSDVDIVGFTMPPKDLVFPHLAGVIPGFGRQEKRFENWQKHHVVDKSVDKEYDMTIYSIVRWFDLVMENNPNMVDSLFLPRRCVLHSTAIYEHVRENRKLFLHKGSYYKFRGYAASQLSKINKGANRSNPKRQESIDKFGFDVKFAYHVVRLFLECEQILISGDLRLDRDSKIYKSIREGEWSLERLNEWVENKDRSMETLYADSTLRHEPDEAAIKQLLVDCLEMHYGNLQDAVVEQDQHGRLVRELEDLVHKHK